MHLQCRRPFVLSSTFEAEIERVCRAGAVMAVSLTLGPIIGGPIVTRLKLSIPRTLIVLVIGHTIVLFAYLIAMLLGCPEAEWAGTITQDGLATFSVFSIY